MKIRAHSFGHIHIAHKRDTKDAFKIKLHLIMLFFYISQVASLSKFYETYTWRYMHIHLDKYTQRINLAQRIFKIKLHISIQILTYRTFRFSNISLVSSIFKDNLLYVLYTYMKIRAHSFRHIHTARNLDAHWYNRF